MDLEHITISPTRIPFPVFGHICAYTCLKIMTITSLLSSHEIQLTFPYSVIVVLASCPHGNIDLCNLCNLSNFYNSLSHRHAPLVKLKTFSFFYWVHFQYTQGLSTAPCTDTFCYIIEIYMSTFIIFILKLHKVYEIITTFPDNQRLIYLIRL